jgi:hypothetical protein
MKNYTKKELLNFINNDKKIKETIIEIKFFDGFDTLQNREYKRLLELVCNDYNLYSQIVELI